MSKKTLILIILLIIAAFVFFGERSDNAGDYETARVRIGDNVFIVEIADDDSKRAKGLSGRESMEENKAMLFLFDKKGQYGFWMKDMKFPLDLIWIDNRKVVDITENLPLDGTPSPKVYTPRVLVDKVLEVNSGKVEETNIRIGQEVEIIVL